MKISTLNTFKNSLYMASLALLLGACDVGSKSSDVAPGSQTGVRGSMASFAITGNTLYIATKQSLDVYDISQAEFPVKTAKTELGVGVETIFPYRNNLYIGANDGMYIFDNTQPKSPRLLTKYSHIMSCDPVAVQDNFAYVTLRVGTECRQFTSLRSCLSYFLG
jgi:hypothetical protein